ncbi:MAG TPA: hypothetical protein VF031_01090, partial [Alphaproteobacteria bacterium]
MFFWLAVVGLAAAGAHYALTKSMQHDVAYYVNAVERLLDGARLYRDLIDVNVPTIYWVTAVPVGAARQLGVPATVGFNVFVLLLAALSAAAVFHSARQGAGHSGWLPEILTGLLLLWFLVLVRHDFGQREHLATILLAPYAVIRAGAGPPGRPGTPLRILIGIGAGVGMSLKPYFVLILAGMEGALLLRRGWRAWAPSWEAAALFATAGGCAAATLLLAPEYLETVVPLARATYHGFEWPILDIIGSMGMRRRLLLASGLLAIVLAWRLDQRSGDLALLFSGGGIGALAAFLLQSKGWVYQLYPALTFSCVAFVIAIAGDLRARLAGRARRVAVAVVGTLVAIGVAGALLELSRAYRADRALREQSAPVLAALRDHAQGGPALFVSLDVDYTFPGVNYAGAAYPYR